jgi:hypothetical protein
VATNMLGVIPKLTKAELDVLKDAFSPPCPDWLVQIMFCNGDDMIKALERYDHYEVADSVAALKSKVRSWGARMKAQRRAAERTERQRRTV